MKLPRSSGILLHISSLPGPFGIGDLGPAAYQFADLLHKSHQKVWQVLPIVPSGFGHSPYASPSTFAGNPLLISPELLVEDGLLDAHDLEHALDFNTQQVQFASVVPYKYNLLEDAFKRFSLGTSHIDASDFEAFCETNAYWLDDYALFAVLKFIHDGKEWTDWDEAVKFRAKGELSVARAQHETGIRMQQFWQFLFYKQWHALKTYCNKRDIKIFGDLPIYVAHDSADVWANQDLFQLDEEGRQTVVAGVPPDYFSETGQRWGNPIYRWDKMEAQDFEWWTNRFKAILEQVDYVRLDHFRGFEAYWEVPASEETAVNGTWVDGPKQVLFERLQEKLGELPVIAENLGVITDGVVSIMEAFEFPGMAILQFAFDGDANSEFLPHNYKDHLVAYTGTHDNDTLMGWWHNDSSTQDEATKQHARQYAQDYLSLCNLPDEELLWTFNRAILASVAKLAILPLQDIIGLDSSARMNTPGTVGDQNWAWRFTFDMIPEGAFERLRHMTELYGRN